MEIPKGDWGVQFRWSLADRLCQAALRRHRDRMRNLRLIFDNDGLWNWGDPEGDGPGLLRAIVDQYADAGARALVWGCGNNLAWSYTPKVQEAWCDRVPTEEPALAVLAGVQRSWLTAGTDPLAVVSEQATTRGLSVLAGFRLNRFIAKFGVETWFTRNPHLMLSEASCPLYASTRSANLALPEVKEHFVRHSIDVVERYDIDGLHLEFMRAVPFFERDEPNKCEHMLEFLRMLRAELDRIGSRRGRPMKLSVWSGTPENYRIIRNGLFPPEFLDLAYLGIDPKAWAAEGLVDILMLSAWSGVAGQRDHVFQVEPWMTVTRGTRMKVFPMVNNAADVSDPESLREAEQTIAEYDGKSDGVFLFNTQPYQLALVLEGKGRYG